MLNIRVEYSLSSIFTILSLTKVYLLSRILTHYSVYTQPREQRVCEAHGTRPTPLFVINTMISERPVLSLAFLSIGTLFFFGIALRLFERGEKSYKEDPNFEHKDGSEYGKDSMGGRSFEDHLWIVIISATNGEG